MRRNETPSDDNKPRRAVSGQYNQVTDRFKRRIRGLWFRDGAYFAQLRVHRKVKQIKLHGADTIPKAQAAMQDLKGKIARGEYPPKSEEAEPQAQQVDQDHSIPAAITKYRAERDLLKKEDPQTRARENSGLNKWNEFCGIRKNENKPIGIEALDSKLLKDFAIWRRKEALKKLEQELNEGEELSEDAEGISGRTLDLDVMAIQKVVSWAVTEKWLPTAPELDWDTLATEPEKIRLLTREELQAFACANLVTPEVLEALPLRIRHLRARQARTAQSFHDFIYLVFFSGGREHETMVQRWSHVTWSKPGKVGHLFFPGAEAKAGAGKPAEDRNVDFFNKLEDHLRDMFERRDKTTDLMFPSIYDPQVPQGSFRKQLEHARKLTGQDDVAFHHGRHYFISHAVMAGADFKTIAYWVSHRDGGVLIGRKYSHLAPGHSKATAQKLNGAF